MYQGFSAEVTIRVDAGVSMVVSLKGSRDCDADGLAMYVAEKLAEALNKLQSTESSALEKERDELKAKLGALQMQAYEQKTAPKPAPKQDKPPAWEAELRAPTKRKGGLGK